MTVDSGQLEALQDPRVQQGYVESKQAIVTIITADRGHVLSLCTGTNRRVPR